MSADMTATTMATYLPEQWSALATVTYRSNIVLADLMDRRWEPELGVGRGDTVNIPAFTQNSAANARSTFGTGAALTFDAVTEAQTQLVVNKMAYKAFRMPAEMSVQAMSAYVPLLTDGIGLACALYVDNQLAADNSNGIDAFTTAVGTDNIDVTDDNILTVETNLDGQNAPSEGRYLVISPATRASIIKIDVIRNQLYSATVGNLKGDAGPGYLGKVYKFNVHQSNNLEAGVAGKKNGGFHREAIALCVQKKLTMVKDLNVEDGLFDQYVGYVVFGHKLVKNVFGNELDGK